MGNTVNQAKEQATKALSLAEHELDELVEKVAPKHRRLVKHHLTMIRSIKLELRDVVIMPREVEDNALHHSQEELEWEA